jgi:hypothetical protein
VENIGQRLDFAVNRDGFLSVVGVNNGSSTTLPDLLCQTYHTLSVGLVNGQHSAGLTEFDIAGRMKPDLVAFNTLTSFAAPQVAGAAGLLSEKIRATTLTPALTAADFPRLTKALLLAGATKEPLAAWSRASTAKPYDATYGAGALNILLPYRIFVSGRQPATNSTLIADTGWDANTVSSGTTQTYFFEIPANSASPRLSAALTWHRTVTYNSFFGTFSSSLRNLNLTLFSVAPSTFTLGTELDASLSTVDNVEHIYQATLAPGRYALRVTVTGGTPISYALAWRTSPTVTLSATAAEARELDGTPGHFTLTRTGPTTTPLYVPLATGGTAVSGAHYTALPAGVLIPAGSASATVQVVPVADLVAQGDRTVTLSIATDFSLSAGSPATATVTIKDKPYDAWRFAKFTAPQLANPAVSDPASDPDSDGIPNLLEYAFAREPLAADSPAALPAIAIGLDDRLTLTYFQASARPDLVFTPEWTSDLTATWQNSATFLTEISRTPAAGGETVTVRAETPLSTSPAQFLRLRVTRP